MAKIYIEWVFKDTYGCSREVLVHGEAWNVHHPQRILLPFRAERQKLRRWIELQICDAGSQVHYRLQRTRFKIVRAENIDRAHFATCAEVLAVWAGCDTCCVEIAFIRDFGHAPSHFQVPLVNVALISAGVQILSVW